VSKNFSLGFKKNLFFLCGGGGGGVGGGQKVVSKPSADSFAVGRRQKTMTICSIKNTHKLYFPSGSKRWIITSAGGGEGAPIRSRVALLLFIVF
jgi:hypothetical protein